MKRILHCHSTFSLGGKEARAVQLMNHFGDAASHVVLSAVPDQVGARDAIDAGIAVEFPGDAAPALYGKPSIGRYRALTRYMAQFDLVLTYNWGSMDAVGARRLFPKNCPPLIHHEDGFNADEAVKLNWKRNGFRRLMLPTAECVIVPSNRLQAIARDVWRQPAERLHRIANGIAVDRYHGPALAGSFPGLERRDGDVIIGTIAGLRAVKNLPRLVRAVAAAGPNVQLAIAGEGPEREKIMTEATQLGMADRMIMPGFLSDPAGYIGHFDIFALSSDSEQFPISLVEAMAAGLPAVSTDVGDVRAMLSPENARFVIDAADEAGLANAIAMLAQNPNLRAQIGAANRQRAMAEYREDRMIERYRSFYGDAMKCADFARQS
jgi:L-malate glycosyltransferase